MRENRHTESFVHLARKKLGLQYCDMAKFSLAERRQQFWGRSLASNNRCL